jgi:hypothetical protein
LAEDGAGIAVGLAPDPRTDGGALQEDSRNAARPCDARRGQQRHGSAHCRTRARPGFGDVAASDGLEDTDLAISVTVNLCLDSDFDFDWPDAIIIRIAEAIHILLHFHHESAHSERFQRAGARAASKAISYQ